MVVKPASAFSLEDLFAEVGFTPNPNQRRAIEYGDGPLFLVAGPGSGKTRVLLWRVVNLIVLRNVDPGDIFLSTFTEKAAKQLKDGLLTLLGIASNHTGKNYDLSKMYVGTVHSLCNRLISDRDFSPGRIRQDTPPVSDEISQYFAISSNRFWRNAQERLDLPEDISEFFTSVNDFFEPDSKYSSASKHKAVTSLISLFNRFSEEYLNPETIIEHPESSEQMRLFARLYRFYQDDALRGGVDLSLLQSAAYNLIEDREASGRIFKHVIVDEYQDTNAIQEKLFFRLAQGHQNICVVGDDDQALYRFRGATVENFVQFPERCQKYLGLEPTRIELNINYRSRERIVDFYSRFMGAANWKDPSGGHYRLHDKGIKAHSDDRGPSVVTASYVHADDAADEIAETCRQLIEQGKVADPNQIAFLFPSLKSKLVERLQKALESKGLRVYAPRARRFLEAEEPSEIFGFFAKVFGRPSRNGQYDGGEYKEFHDWLDNIEQRTDKTMEDDAQLARFIEDRRADLKRVLSDYQTLTSVIADRGWELTATYYPDLHKRDLYGAPGLSQEAKRGLGGRYLDNIVKNRLKERESTQPPFTLKYIVNRATSLDWNVLDFFYRLCGFEHFKKMFDLAEDGTDEGPVCNLSLVSQYLARFIDVYQSVITASFLEDKKLRNVLFGSFLFALWRIGEGEYEDKENPFPRGRIPFLTIHQSKGLEFPVVVLGNLNKRDRGAQTVETLVRPYLTGDPEPLERVGEFDIMRMFYVALSRAKQLMIFNGYKGAHRTNAFKSVMARLDLPELPDLDITALKDSKLETDDLARAYSYTGDYLAYLRCPRRYMVFNKYDFAASRTQTMFFGSLVHRTIEDLHNRIIAQRQERSTP